MPSNNALEKAVNLGQLQMAYEAGALLPVDISTLTPASTFQKNAVVGINGVLYRATAATQNLPCTLTVQDGQFVVNIVNGKTAFTVADPAPNEGWEVFTDASVEYWIADAVLLEPVPPITGILCFVTSTAKRMASICSGSVRVDPSPVVPTAIMQSVPPAICSSISSSNLS
jgi:hypothetical protein